MSQFLVLRLRKTVFSMAYLLLVILPFYGTAFTIQHSKHQKRPCETVDTEDDGIRRNIARHLATRPSLISPSSSQRIRLHPLRAATSTPESNELGERDAFPRERRFLNEKQLDFVLGYLNKHHGIFLSKLAETFSQVGVEKAKKNAWSGGSYQILSSTIINIDTASLELDVEIKERKGGLKVKRVTVDLGK